MATNVLKVSDAGTLFDILSKQPTGETNRALAVAGYVYDGSLWRPLKATTAGEPQVQLTGRTPTRVTLTTTPLNAGATFAQTVQAIDSGPLASSLVVTPSHTAVVRYSDGASHYQLEIAIMGGITTIIPAIRHQGRQWQWSVYNPKSVAQTSLTVEEIRHFEAGLQPRVVRAVLVDGLAIRDQGVWHHYASDPEYIFNAKVRASAVGARLIEVYNAHDQLIRLRLVFFIEGKFSGYISPEIDLPAGASKTIANATFPDLDAALEMIGVQAVAPTAAPTTGALQAYMNFWMGGE